MSASQSDTKLVVAPESGLSEVQVRTLQTRLQATLKDLSREDHDLRQRVATPEVHLPPGVRFILGVTPARGAIAVHAHTRLAAGEDRTALRGRFVQRQVGLATDGLRQGKDGKERSGDCESGQQHTNGS